MGDKVVSCGSGKMITQICVLGVLYSICLQGQFVSTQVPPDDRSYSRELLSKILVAATPSSRQVPISSVISNVIQQKKNGPSPTDSIQVKSSTSSVLLKKTSITSQTLLKSSSKKEVTPTQASSTHIDNSSNKKSTMKSSDSLVVVSSTQSFSSLHPSIFSNESVKKSTMKSSDSLVVSTQSYSSLRPSISSSESVTSSLSRKVTSSVLKNDSHSTAAERSSSLLSNTVSFIHSTSLSSVRNITSSSCKFSSSYNPLCTTTTVVICSSSVISTMVMPTPTASFHVNKSSLIFSSPSLVMTSNVSFSQIKTSSLQTIPSFTTGRVISSTQLHTSSEFSSKISISSAIQNISTAASVQFSSAIPIQPPIKQCDGVIMTFSEAVSNFTQCVLLNMHHMSVCRVCVKPYDALQNLHKELFKDCGSTLIGSFNENYQVVPKILNAQRNTWHELGCENCIDRSSGSTTLTEKFKEFLELYHKTMECFRNNTFDNFPSAVIKNHTFPSNDTDSKQVCIVCKDLYGKIQSKFKYFDENEDESTTPWCADINVAVNETRHIWGSQFKCSRAQKDLESIIALTCFFCFLPIVFYVGAKLHSEVKERKTNRYYESE